MSNNSIELEWKTRKERIDKALLKHWNIINYSSSLDLSTLKNHAVREYPTATGPADYVLFVDGKPLAVLEAKKISVSAQEVLGQAKRYSRGMAESDFNFGGYKIPFLYSSNGETIWFLDARNEKNTRRKVKTMHTPQAMLDMLASNKEQAMFKLKSTPIDDNARLRPYQSKAISSTELAILNGKREMLVAMATGTGKTFLTVSQIYRLLSSGMFKRVLFLVDRKALAAQAVRAFASFDTPKGSKFDKEYEVYSQAFKKEDFGEDEPFNPKLLPNEYLTSPGKNHTFVYICTIQRMSMNLFGKDAVSEESAGEIGDKVEMLDIPIHAFDLIVTDECHRGYTSKETSAWRDTLEYFDCVKIGLTATPAPHSLSLFKEVIYRYTTDEAIADGYLVDYEAVKISSGVKMNGVFLHEGESVGLIDNVTGKEVYDELEDEREFSSSDIERKITAPNTNKKIISEIKKYTDKFEEENGRFPKTLIFAVNDLRHKSHADRIVRCCRDIFNRGDSFVQKITGSPTVDRPLQRIREFRNRPEPKIVVTVDMLTTGVDVPAIEFIVFLRPVKSRILWVQMLGRGTRLCPDIHKTHFTVFDCFDGTLIEYFKGTNEMEFEPPQKDPITIHQVIENIWNNDDRDYNSNVLVKRLRRIEKNMSGEAREQFSSFIDNGDIGKFAGELKNNINNNFTSTMETLKDQSFIDLLINYPRAKSSFLIAYEVVDTVSSEWIFKIGDETVKPEDYLLSFEKFVRSNPEHIDAIEILLNRPKEWKTDVLSDLRKKMKKSQFKEPDLQKAHKIVFGKALADIISMIKHSAEQSDIYSAEERVELTMRKFMSDTIFSPEELKWLELIRQHLIENLTIDVDDFEYMPIFYREGGKSKAKQIFGNLTELVDRLNELIAS